ncbi:MAG: type II toxin-antitoxin system prevent-host-death family antitoxin [Zoogloeaceae bacterium]|jgi:prevent-host-death family protein|nr:type II toxin-antitoxin system prevent-host-death family antitoxin [Zoogloeaceae bacterium]
MQIVNIHEAKTHLSRLIQRVVEGESVVIARASKPLVKIVPLDAPTENKARRLGCLSGEISVPDDFDQMGREEIERLFSLEP